MEHLTVFVLASFFSKPHSSNIKLRLTRLVLHMNNQAELFVAPARGGLTNMLYTVAYIFDSFTNLIPSTRDKEITPKHQINT